MTFGRQSNMSRRPHRADEGFHRSKRRKGVDRLAMLELYTNPPPPSRVRGFLSVLTGIFRRKA